MTHRREKAWVKTCLGIEHVYLNWRSWVFSLLFLSAPMRVWAAEFEKIELTNSCSYFGEQLPESVFEFQAEDEAVQIISRIVARSGLPANFKVKAAGVPNAAAVTHEGARYILYNQTFVRDLKQATSSKWSAVSVLAHEVGHHLSGHTLGSSNNQLRQELEADRYSGFVLQELGATLKQAQLTIFLIGSDVASKTHPAKHDRLAAIASGWLEACKKSNCDVPMQKHSVKTSSKRSNQSSRSMAALQKYLNERGCDAGAVDGVLGAKTRQAHSWYLETLENINKLTLPAGSVLGIAKGRIIDKVGSVKAQEYFLPDDGAKALEFLSGQSVMCGQTYPPCSLLPRGPVRPIDIPENMRYFCGYNK